MTVNKNSIIYILIDADNNRKLYMGKDMRSYELHCLDAVFNNMPYIGTMFQYISKLYHATESEA